MVRKVGLCGHVCFHSRQVSRTVVRIDEKALEAVSSLAKGHIQFDIQDGNFAVGDADLVETVKKTVCNCCSTLQTCSHNRVQPPNDFFYHQVAARLRGARYAKGGHRCLHLPGQAAFAQSARTRFAVCFQQLRAALAEFPLDDAFLQHRVRELVALENAAFPPAL